MAGIDIAGSYNARWSGGREGGLARSAALDEVGPAGADQLAALGIQLVIDLREPGERGTPRHGRTVAAVPLYRLPDGPPQTGDLESVYDFLLRERGAALAEAVAAIADAPGPALVHCTAGKDRTGIVVALALLVAGVDRSVVLADYARSQANLGGEWLDGMLGLMASHGIEATPELRVLMGGSPPEALDGAIRFIEDAHGSVTQYLLDSGMSLNDLAALRSALVEPSAG